jgi:hypothetical protein
MNYEFQALFSVFRLVLGFFFVFALVTPLFFSFIGKKKGIDRIVFSWVALGAIIIAGIFILVNLHIYDFISILFCLLMIPFLFHFFRSSWEGNTISDIFFTGENRIVAKQVVFIEKIRKLTRQEIRDKVFKKPSLRSENPYGLVAIGLGIGASILRIIPSIENSSPFSRTWYFELDAVKNLSLQQYFSGYPTPKGMHSIINFFSTITQVSPEMILHILGALISFFLTIIIFWLVRDITRGKHQSAALFSAMIYAIMPTLFLPISMELETEITTLSFALCFAVPTMLFFLRNIRSDGKTPWFYIYAGIVATVLSDIFVLLMVLLPFFIVSLISVLKKTNIIGFAKIYLNLLLVFSLSLSPYILFCFANGYDLGTFFQNQLFNTQVYSFTPNLILPLENLSVVYIILALFLLTCYLIRFFVQDINRIGDEIVFLILFIIISFIYTPYFEYQYVWIDPDQLNIFYGILICILGGLLIYSILIFFEWIFEIVQDFTSYIGPALTTVLGIWFLILQGGFEVSRILPKTEPNGFFDAYYNIINERVPYTYATVGPEIDRELASNRHYFMNYQYFLSNYGAIDSLYQLYLMVPAEQRTDVEEVPPASIFLFVEKPPYGSIQQGILFDAQGTMRDLQQWLASYRELEGRQLEVYHETEETIIYEIINREGESTIGGVLGNIYPTDQGRAGRFFK